MIGDRVHLDPLDARLILDALRMAVGSGIRQIREENGRFAYTSHSCCLECGADRSHQHTPGCRLHRAVLVLMRELEPERVEGAE